MNELLKVFQRALESSCCEESELISKYGDVSIECENDRRYGRELCLC